MTNIRKNMMLSLAGQFLTDNKFYGSKRIHPENVVISAGVFYRHANDAREDGYNPSLNRAMAEAFGSEWLQTADGPILWESIGSAFLDWMLERP
jgi:hypothetical protein